MEHDGHEDQEGMKLVREDVPQYQPPFQQPRQFDMGGSSSSSHIPFDDSFL